MNSLYRAVTQSSRKCPLRFLLQSSHSISSSSSSSISSSGSDNKVAVSKESCDWPRPKEIPFQAKASNSVNLTGYVSEPIQFQASPDHRFWAATVISQHHPSSDSPHFWIPVIFEGDLARAAASHLKINDHVHIAGKLSADAPPIDVTHGQAQVRIMVQNINFIQGSFPIKKSCGHQQKIEDFVPEQQEKEPLKDSGIAKGDEYVEQSWKDLLTSPHEWWDIRSQVDNPKGASFERKKNGELLYIDHATPKWIQEKLEGMAFDKKTTVEGGKGSMIKNGDSVLNSWRELASDPKQWWDYRSSKLNGLVNPKHPDFKRKDGGVALWLNKAPRWILSELEKLEFDVQIPKSKQVKQHKGDANWTDLVGHPNKWWDNRLNKKNERYPDFKHKETGVGLWLSNSPTWVLSELPPMKGDKNAATSN
ncbi:protein OSB2, chloroplastic [Ricinus communis]|uniref:protein OSB2, chloroplastic n=1 Tax=Ricinus communis TaxID=3988 RepID=UPI00201A3D69|nr:protein OSB2, chloroplastic [Ricinus communis]XP_015581089.2 protein OSB2, chloroplastic [Ricinus communis]